MNQSNKGKHIARQKICRNTIDLETFNREINELKEVNEKFKHLCQIHITYDCNMPFNASCRNYCFQYQRKGQYMSLNTFATILNTYTPRQIALGGGEPTLHPNFLSLLNYAKHSAKIPIKHINFTTNALELRHKVDVLSDYISGISISIDTLRYPKMFDHSLPDNLANNLKIYADSPMQIFLNYVIDETNQDTIIEAAQFAYERDLNGIYFLGMKRRDKKNFINKNDLNHKLLQTKNMFGGNYFVIGTDCCISNYLSNKEKCNAGETTLAFDVDGTPHNCSFQTLLGNSKCPFLK
ncbi:MAG: radical SAM protein [Candidatus Lokiarchaeota archaeon]|nr:radical SAM protein [Candidatus Lokiarchaeota archaeon]